MVRQLTALTEAEHTVEITGVCAECAATRAADAG